MAVKKKAAAKKAAPKKAAPKKAVTKKAAPKKKAAPAKAAPAPKALKAIKEPMTKSAMLVEMAERSGVAKKDVVAVMGALSELIEAHVKKGGAGVCNVPGLMKIKVVRKPATRARKGINPFTGEETVFKAKPARNVVKIQPLKALKDMV